MKQIFALILLLLFISCGNNNQNNKMLDDLKSEIFSLKKENKKLKDSVQLFKYPIEQRFKKIDLLIEKKEYEKSYEELDRIQLLFPNNQDQIDIYKIEIDRLNDIELNEQKRLKAQGFKGLNEMTNVEIGECDIKIGNFTTSKTFTFDDYGDSYYYKTADKDSKYISAKITISSSNKNPQLPATLAYTVDGDKLVYLGTFLLRFARWDNYGSYLGNYSDNGNNFSKVNSIPFKIGLELSDQDLTKAIIVLISDEYMTRNYDKFNRPPISYTSSLSYSPHKNLDIETVKDCKILKIFNRNSL